MARVRVFVSSTYYDLKHVRASLETFVEGLGYEPVLFEKGAVAFDPDIPLDESCYREVASADIFVLIIGGRYGSESSAQTELKAAQERTKHEFFDRYNSVTKEEYRRANDEDIPVYILIDRYVYAEYRTFLNNRDNTAIKYAHVDSVNVFHLIGDILSKLKNNAFHEFERYSDIEVWLREQWSGYFKELLRRRSEQKRTGALSAKIEELTAVSDTLKAYLEKVVEEVLPSKVESASLIKSQEQRLEEARQIAQLDNYYLTTWLRENYRIQPERFYRAIITARNIDEFVKLLKLDSAAEDTMAIERPFTDPQFIGPFRDLNEIREKFNLPKFVRIGDVKAKKDSSVRTPAPRRPRERSVTPKAQPTDLPKDQIHVEIDKPAKGKTRRKKVARKND